MNEFWCGKSGTAKKLNMAFKEIISRHDNPKQNLGGARRGLGDSVSVRPRRGDGSMTRGDLVAIAKALSDARLVRNDAGMVQWWQVVELIASACASRNRRFDREKFLAACSRESS